MKEETAFTAGKGSFSADSKTYHDALSRAIREHEALSKQLHKQQKEVKENHDAAVDRRKLYVQLKTIMQLKLKLVNQEKVMHVCCGVT